MTEIASTSSGRGHHQSPPAPIMNLADDHLFTVLLLLPVDSILSFSATCKRFRNLACSDSLGSPCGGESGASSAESVKSSSSSTWMNLKPRRDDDDDVSSSSLLLPLPRASHSLNFVTDYLVLFGGGREGGRHLDDTWTAYVGESNHKTLKWKKADSVEWVATRKQFLWKLLSVVVGAPKPPPRGAHAASCISEKTMVVQGGIGLSGVRLGDTWILELSEDLNSGTWHEVVSSALLPPRSGHTLTYIRENQVVLFGGRGLGLGGKCIVAEGWSLCDAHIGRSILIYGGEDTFRHKKDDFWALDVKTIPSKGLQVDGGAVCLNGSKAWKRLDGVSYRPKGRSFHRACADSSGRYVYVLVEWLMV
ncbi:F-box/kelch-repeat protein [Raphanus sativus]|nr:F-box/kelch-repeat protein [Raphanus sativus]